MKSEPLAHRVPGGGLWDVTASPVLFGIAVHVSNPTNRGQGQAAPGLWEFIIVSLIMREKISLSDYTWPITELRGEVLMAKILQTAVCFDILEKE